jgi:flagellar FliJ protein
MIMTRSKRLTPIADLASRNERDAAKQLAVSNKELADAEAKLAELQRCRSEYEAQFEGNAGLVIGAARLREYRAFIQQLDQAIAALGQQIARQQKRQENARSTWMQQRHRATALNDLVAKHRRDELRGEERRSQNEIDDLTQQTRS